MNRIDELLNAFVAKEEDWRPFYLTPKRTEKYVFASDPKCAIVIDKNIVDDYEQYEEYSEENFRKLVFAPHDCNYVISMEDLSAALDKIPLVDECVKFDAEIDCPECDGHGEVEWEYNSDYAGIVRKWWDCPRCDGTGAIQVVRRTLTGRQIPDTDAKVAILDFGVEAAPLFKLREAMKLLGVDKARLTTKDNPRGLLSVFLTPEISVRFMKVAFREDWHLEENRLHIGC